MINNFQSNLSFGAILKRTNSVFFFFFFFFFVGGGGGGCCCFFFKHTEQSTPNVTNELTLNKEIIYYELPVANINIPLP